MKVRIAPAKSQLDAGVLGLWVGDFRRAMVYDNARQSRFINLLQVPRCGETEMRKLLVASVIVISGWTVFAMTSGAQDDKKVAIKEVMKVAMKGGLCKKVADGQANDEEKKKIAGLFAALHENKPPKGEQTSWDEKTKALVDAADAVLAGKEGAGEKLRMAANCNACHMAHKGK